MPSSLKERGQLSGVATFPTAPEGGGARLLPGLGGRWRALPACSAAPRQLSHAYVQTQINRDRANTSGYGRETAAPTPPLTRADTAFNDADDNTKNPPAADVQNRNRPGIDGECKLTGPK